ncbi:MAG: hypothetical protein IPK82_33390 [Polyangiaceae bacterium]|nr:hypothetical protein [Polyangiaceae bacterium]
MVIGSVVLTALAAVTLGFLFRSPGRVARLLDRLRVELTPSGTSGAATLVWQSMPATVGYLVGLQCLSMLGVSSNTWALPALTAWVIDAIAGHRARNAKADLVTVWTDERPFAAAAAEAALRHRGIEVVAVGLAQRSLFQFGAGYAPIELRVPTADASRAHKLLRAALPDPTTAASPQREGSERAGSDKLNVDRPRKKKPPLIAAALGPMRGATKGVIAVAAFLLGLVVINNATRPGPPRPPTAEEIEQRSKLLQMVRVEDDADPFNAVLDGINFPTGVRIERENAPVGPGNTVPRWFARAILQEGETLDALEARIRPWLNSIPVPPGTHLALQEDAETDDENGAPVVYGFRTFLVADEPMLTGADVLAAHAYPDQGGAGGAWLVRLQFTTDGGERFRQVTAANIKRRFAIVVRGRVVSAPVIQTEISGGKAVITMGSTSDSRQLAVDLAKALTTP